MNFFKISFLFSLVFIVGCDLLDRDEEIPAFLRVNTVELVGGIPGSDECFDNKIYNIEVFVEGRNIGIYAVGSDIPVFEEGIVDIEIFPLVAFAGSSQILEPHLFLQKIERTLEFNSGIVNEIDVEANYYDDISVYISEDFESLPFTFTEDVDEDTLTGLTVELNSFCSDNHVGAFHLTDSSRLSIVTTTNLNQILNLPSDQAYLEVDYLSELNLTFSFYTLTGNGEPGFSNLYFVNPKNNWNRLYINMSDYIRDSNAERFQMLISAELPLLDAVGDTIRSGSAYLDNIRVISF